MGSLRRMADYRHLKESRGITGLCVAIPEVEGSWVWKELVVELSP